jgi:hypothetical protein
LFQETCPRAQGDRRALRALGITLTNKFISSKNKEQEVQGEWKFATTTQHLGRFRRQVGMVAKESGQLTPSLLLPVFLPQRVKYLLTPREPNRWAVEREGAVPFDSRKSMNGALMKPTHIVVETMM